MIKYANIVNKYFLCRVNLISVFNPTNVSVRIKTNRHAQNIVPIFPKTTYIWERASITNTVIRVSIIKVL